MSYSIQSYMHAGDSTAAINMLDYMVEPESLYEQQFHYYDKQGRQHMQRSSDEHVSSMS